MIDLARITEALRTDLSGPLRVRLSQALRVQIIDGTLKPGDPLPPARILESKLGLSRTVIRQAMCILVDEGLMNAIVGVGNFVQGAPAALPTKGVVAILIPVWFSTLYMRLVSSFTQRMRPAGYSVELNIYDDTLPSFQETFESAVSHSPQGVAFVGPHASEILRIVSWERLAGVPAIMIARDLKLDLDYVGVDNFSTGYAATRTLIELGHRGIVHVHYPIMAYAGRERAAGYARAMREAGLPPCFKARPIEGIEEFVPDEFSAYSLADLAEFRGRLAGPALTAAFCSSDENAIWLQKELRRCSRVVPHDFSLIGVDNQPYAEFFDAPLSTFQLPGSEIGICAAELMQRRLAGEYFARQFIQLPAAYLPRLSVAAPPQAVS